MRNIVSERLLSWNLCLILAPCGRQTHTCTYRRLTHTLTDTHTSRERRGGLREPTRNEN